MYCKWFFEKQSLGVQDDTESKSIDGMNPSSREDFVELTKLIVGKLSNYQVRVFCKKKGQPWQVKVRLCVF